MVTRARRVRLTHPARVQLRMLAAAQLKSSNLLATKVRSAIAPARDEAALACVSLANLTEYRCFYSYG
jgi:hypothetical protein